jgi:imidazolonepropionase-like amidohydrolase
MLTSNKSFGTIMRFRLMRGFALLSLSCPVFCQTATPLLIRDVRLFDGKRVLEHRTVLVENGKIARIASAAFGAPGAEVIDGRGRTLLPGFFDAHVHISPAEPEGALRQTLSFGVTTALDMFTNAALLTKMKAIEAADAPDLADLRSAGVGATAPGGHPSEMANAEYRASLPTITDPEQAAAFVEARIQEGSDYIKIIYDDLSAYMTGNWRFPMLSRETLRALVEAAHRRGKLAVVHIGTEQQARDAIEAGADGLAHMFTGEHAGKDFGRLAASRRVFVIPTLTTLYVTCGEAEGRSLLGDPQLKPYIQPAWQAFLEQQWPYAKASCQGTAEGVRQLAQAHVPILAGTDAPMPGTTYGASLHEELRLLVRAGLTPVQALEAATSVPARAFHLEDRGMIQARMRADMVLVNGDPTKDILATRNIVAIWKRGIRAAR